MISYHTTTMSARIEQTARDVLDAVLKHQRSGSQNDDALVHAILSAMVRMHVGDGVRDAPPILAVLEQVRDHKVNQPWDAKQSATADAFLEWLCTKSERPLPTRSQKARPSTRPAELARTMLAMALTAVTTPSSVAERGSPSLEDECMTQLKDARQLLAEADTYATRLELPDDSKLPWKTLITLGVIGLGAWLLMPDDNKEWIATLLRVIGQLLITPIRAVKDVTTSFQRRTEYTTGTVEPKFTQLTDVHDTGAIMRFPMHQFPSGSPQRRFYERMRFDDESWHYATTNDVLYRVMMHLNEWSIFSVLLQPVSLSLIWLYQRFVKRSRWVSPVMRALVLAGGFHVWFVGTFDAFGVGLRDTVDFLQETVGWRGGLLSQIGVEGAGGLGLVAMRVLVPSILSGFAQWVLVRGVATKFTRIDTLWRRRMVFGLVQLARAADAVAKLSRTDAASLMWANRNSLTLQSQGALDRKLVLSAPAATAYVFELMARTVVYGQQFDDLRFDGYNQVPFALVMQLAEAGLSFILYPAIEFVWAMSKEPEPGEYLDYADIKAELADVRRLLRVVVERTDMAPPVVRDLRDATLATGDADLMERVSPAVAMAARMHEVRSEIKEAKDDGKAEAAASSSVDVSRWFKVEKLKLP